MRWVLSDSADESSYYLFPEVRDALFLVVVGVKPLDIIEIEVALGHGGEGVLFLLGHLRQGQHLLLLGGLGDLLLLLLLLLLAALVAPLATLAPLAAAGLLAQLHAADHRRHVRLVH